MVTPRWGQAIGLDRRLKEKIGVLKLGPLISSVPLKHRRVAPVCIQKGKPMLKNHISRSLLMIAAFWFVPASGFSESGPIIEFDAPGAGTGAKQGTFAININGFGVAVGYFVDANIVPHGFVRSPFGHVKTIDAPGAGMVPGANQGTVAESINEEGTIAGQYQDTNFVFHCFLRYPDGHIITFDAPGAGAGPNQGSVAVDINLEGTIAGFIIDNNNVQHGFVRSSWGAFTSFDAPGAGKGPFEGTMVTLESGLNVQGDTIGWSIVTPATAHGFVRSSWGAFTSFDAPGAGKGPFEGTMVTLESGLNVQGDTIGWSIVTPATAHGFVRERNGAIALFDPPGSILTVPGAINSEGLIVGGAYDANFVLHGFIRNINGAIITFDVPGAGSTPGSGEGTLALGASFFGLSTGYWIDSSEVFHGFLRYPNGAIFKFDAPGSGAVPRVTPPQGTVPQGMNFWGEVVGFVVDTNNVAHGFIRIP
jgi:hypothetical protein